MKDITQAVVAPVVEQPKKKRYTLIGENKDQVLELREKPAAGVRTAYSSFNDNITYKKKFFCIVYAMPTSGKSEFVLQECLNLSDKHGWKHILFTPEQGEPEDIIALLVHKRLGKTVNPIPGLLQASPEEILTVMGWLNKHFIIVNTDEGISMEDIFDIVDEIKTEYNWTADNIVIDNHNDLSFDIGPSGRQDLAIEQQLTNLRRNLKKRDMYAFLVTHTADLGKPITTDNVTYYPVPNPAQTRGGQSLYRKAYLMINLWRCPYGLTDRNGFPYQRNQTLITVQKAKPTHTGMKGFEGYIYWLSNMSRFTDQPPTIILHDSPKQS